MNYFNYKVIIEDFLSNYKAVIIKEDLIVLKYLLIDNNITFYS